MKRTKYFTFANPTKRNIWRWKDGKMMVSDTDKGVWISSFIRPDSFTIIEHITRDEARKIVPSVFRHA